MAVPSMVTMAGLWGTHNELATRIHNFTFTDSIRQ